MVLSKLSMLVELEIEVGFKAEVDVILRFPLNDKICNVVQMLGGFSEKMQGLVGVLT